MNKFGISVFRFSLLVVLMSGCIPAAPPLLPTNISPTNIPPTDIAPTTIPPTNIPPTPIPATTVAVGGITTTTVKIVQEQGSGAVCSADTTYFVALDITSNGATPASYEISATDGSGQVADGVFDQFGSPYVADSLVFNGAGTQTVLLRLTGPYSYPDTITIRARVNGGDWQIAQPSCATGEGTAGGETGATGGITNTNLNIVQEQGSGAVCSADTTYFVSLAITSNGATSAIYEISATDGSGQVADGVFDQFGSPFVTDSLVFGGAETQTVLLRLTGPYSYPDTITIRARVNGGEFQQAQIQCQ